MVLKTFIIIVFISILFTQCQSQEDGYINICDALNVNKTEGVCKIYIKENIKFYNKNVSIGDSDQITLNSNATIALLNGNIKLGGSMTLKDLYFLTTEEYMAIKCNASSSSGGTNCLRGKFDKIYLGGNYNCFYSLTPYYNNDYVLFVTLFYLNCKNPKTSPPIEKGLGVTLTVVFSILGTLVCTIIVVGGVLIYLDCRNRRRNYAQYIARQQQQQQQQYAESTKLLTPFQKQQL